METSLPVICWTFSRSGFKKKVQRKSKRLRKKGVPASSRIDRLTDTSGPAIDTPSGS
jgi:hypothetical protein